MTHAIRYHRAQVSTASGLDVLAGAWLLISPFVLMLHAHSVVPNNVVLGTVIGVLALIRFFNRTYETVWMSWINALLGIWVLISPWVLGFSAVQTAMANNISMGIIIIALACWSALATVDSRERNNRRDETTSEM